LRDKSPVFYFTYGLIGSVEIIVFITFLGAFAVPPVKGKLKKMSIRTSSIYIAPATAAAPLVISIENRFIMDLW
jgi:hypothetical protein